MKSSFLYLKSHLNVKFYHKNLTLELRFHYVDSKKTGKTIKMCIITKNWLIDITCSHLSYKHLAP